MRNQFLLILCGSLASTANAAVTEFTSATAWQQAAGDYQTIDFTGFEERILKYQPRVVAFTSKRGAAEYFKRPTAKVAYGLQEEKIGETRIFVLTSPSGAAGPHWKEEPWQELAALVKENPEN